MTGPSGGAGWWGGTSRGQDRLTLPDLASNDALSLELAGRPQRSVGGPDRLPRERVAFYRTSRLLTVADP